MYQNATATDSQQAPVEDPTGADQGPQLARIPGELVELDQEEQQLGADQGADDDRDAEVP